MENRRPLDKIIFEQNGGPRRFRRGMRFSPLLCRTAPRTFYDELREGRRRSQAAHAGLNANDSTGVPDTIDRRLGLTASLINFFTTYPSYQVTGAGVTATNASDLHYGALRGKLAAAGADSLALTARTARNAAAEASSREDSSKTVKPPLSGGAHGYPPSTTLSSAETRTGGTFMDWARAIPSFCQGGLRFREGIAAAHWPMRVDWRQHKPQEEAKPATSKSLGSTPNPDLFNHGCSQRPVPRSAAHLLEKSPKQTPSGSASAPLPV